MKEKLLQFICDKRLETWLWETINSLLVVSVVIVQDMNWLLAPFIIALLNQLTKYINVKYIK